jgi:GntR family transcriptional regulator
MDEAVASVPDFDSDNRRTGYRQIAQTIKNWILSGRLNVGDKIPTENQLSTHFSVARLTVRRALKVLVDDGILTQNGLSERLSQNSLSRVQSLHHWRHGQNKLPSQTKAPFGP